MSVCGHFSACCQQLPGLVVLGVTQAHAHLPACPHAAPGGGSYSRSPVPGPRAARAPRLPCTYLLMGGCLGGYTPLYNPSPGVHGHYTAQLMMQIIKLDGTINAL